VIRGGSFTASDPVIHLEISFRRQHSNHSLEMSPNSSISVFAFRLYKAFNKATYIPVDLQTTIHESRGCSGKERGASRAQTVALTAQLFADGACDRCNFDGNDASNCKDYGIIDNSVLVAWDVASSDCLDAFNIRISTPDPPSLICASASSFVNELRFGSSLAWIRCV